jgi:hypothetical protein
MTELQQKRKEAFDFFCQSDYPIKHSKTATLDKYKTILSYIIENGSVTMNQIIGSLNQNDFNYPLLHLNKAPAKLKLWKVLQVNEKKSGEEILDINLNIYEYFTNTKLSNKALLLLEKSRESAILAVEIYNKPLITFKTEAFITLMINAWNKLFLAFFVKYGDPYQENRNNKNWTFDLETCIDKYKATHKIDNAVEENLLLCKKYRNFVEHNVLNIDFADYRLIEIFQALLFNYEEFVVEHFGREFIINQSLSVSLQFSDYEETTLGKVKKQFISYVKKNGIGEFINSNCSKLEDEILKSQKFRVKLIPQAVEISNTSACDLEIVFKKATNDTNTSIAVMNKYKNVLGVDYKIRKLSIKAVNQELKKRLSGKFEQHHCTYINQMFSICNRNGNKLDTIGDYCLPDTDHINEDDHNSVSKVGYRYHIKKYPNLISKILEAIDYDLDFLKIARSHHFSINDLKPLKSLYREYQAKQ